MCGESKKDCFFGDIVPCAITLLLQYVVISFP